MVLLHEKFPLSSVSPLLSLSYFHLAPQAFNHLFQTGASCTWTTGPKEHAFKPCKERDTVCVCVCVCTASHFAFSEKEKEREREGGFNMQIPPPALSASSHIVHSNTDMGRNEEDTQVNSAELSQWV